MFLGKLCGWVTSMLLRCHVPLRVPVDLLKPSSGGGQLIGLLPTHNMPDCSASFSPASCCNPDSHRETGVISADGGLEVIQVFK